ncbi:MULTISPECIES: lipopolysaccharide biosynthesis protein [Thalassospira]|uniref:Lipopolysaccharide biosynthesis protein n=2 Tax=Thalassospira povalilytica TaxID=732237 RepID=A0A8I1SIM9_9PROT|nr:lipopolysaccharide biosynthesis protein [Thalassospira povalilytica]MBN8195939.1 lipopolysaccharide biosynthesis protein [Thalassospira povalilytica]
MVLILGRKALDFIRSDLGMRFLAEAAARCTGFVVTPLISWVLGAAVFGSYTQILSLSFAFVPIVSAGLGYTVIRQVASRVDSHGDPGVLVFSIGLISVLCSALALAMFVFADFIAGFVSLGFPVSPLSLALAVSVLAWMTSVEALIQEYFRALKLVKQSLQVQLVSIFLHLALLLAFTFAGHLSIWSAIGVLIFAKMLVNGFVLARTILYGRKERKDQLKMPGLRVLVSGVPFMLSGLAEWAGNLGDRLVVGKYLGAETVAHYTAAMMLLSVIAALGAPLWWLLFPEIVRERARGNSEGCARIVQSRTMVFVWLAFPALTLICVIANPAISLLVNAHSLDMVLVVLVLGMAMIINQLATGWEYYVVSATSGKQLMVATMACALIGFGGAVLFAPLYGILGVALGLLCGKMLFALVCAGLARRYGFPGTVVNGPKTALLAIASVLVYFLVSTILGYFGSLGDIAQVVSASCLVAMIFAAGYLACYRKKLADQFGK